MKEYKHGSAIIRVHGEIDREKLKESTITFLKKAKRCKHEKKKTT